MALRGLDPNRPITVTLVTDQAAVPCTLDAQRAPHGVALFVGLATGRATWRHPRTGEVTTRPLYIDLPFFRGIPGVLVQSGCVVGDGSGHPGYRIEVEAHADDTERLRQPGALVLARYTPPPHREDPAPPPAGHVLGSQFAVTLTDMSHLAGKVSVLGRCGNLDVVRSIARHRTRQAPSARLLRVELSGVEPIPSRVTSPLPRLPSPLGSQDPRVDANREPWP